jgi:hypothetical protein
LRRVLLSVLKLVLQTATPVALQEKPESRNRRLQNQLRLARKVPLLAPSELETACAWLKPTHHAWFARASLIWSTSTSSDQIVLFRIPIEYYRIATSRLLFSSIRSFGSSVTYEI